MTVLPACRDQALDMPEIGGDDRVLTPCRALHDGGVDNVVMDSRAEEPADRTGRLLRHRLDLAARE